MTFELEAPVAAQTLGPLVAVGERYSSVEKTGSQRRACLGKAGVHGMGVVTTSSSQEKFKLIIDDNEGTRVRAMMLSVFPRIAEFVSTQQIRPAVCQAECWH